MRRVLSAFLLAALLCGCSRKPQDGRALFAQVRPQSDAIIANPSGATPKRVARVARVLEALVEKQQGQLGAGMAQEALGKIYLARGEPAKARAYFEQIPWYYRQYYDLCMKSLVYIGQTYEAELNWDAAEKAYQAIDDYYPWSPLWADAKLFAGQMYEGHGDTERATQAYKRAILVLMRRAADAPSPEMEARLRMKLATAHERIGERQAAIAVLEAIVKEFPDRPEARDAQAKLDQLASSSP